LRGVQGSRETEKLNKRGREDKNGSEYPIVEEMMYIIYF